MLDLVVIHPGAAHGIYGSDLANSLIAVEPPVWARIIAGYVRERGFTVAIIDAEARGLSPADAAALAVSYEPRLICIAVYGHQPSAATQQMYGAGLTAKAIPPKYKTIMVGGHVAALPEQTLKEEAVDFTCNGEGLETIVGLLAEEPLEEIPGLVWHDEVLIRNNKPAKLVHADDMAGDVWDLLDMSLYRSHNWQRFGSLELRQPYASIYTSFGCPFKCEFCCIQAPFSPDINGNRYRTRSPEKVVAEIVMLYNKYGVKTFKIADEMYVLQKRHVLAICDGLIASGIADDISCWAYSRIDTVKEGMLPKLRAAGVRWLALGIEAAEEYVRDGAEKHFTNADIVRVVRDIEAHDIHVIANFIVGLADDTKETMQHTLDMALELNTAFMNVYACQAYPGSKMYTDSVRDGRVLPASNIGYSQHNKYSRPMDTKHVSGAEVLKFRDEFFLKYFTNTKYLEMVKEKFGEETLEHVKAMTTYKLERWLVNPPEGFDPASLGKVYA